MIPLTTAYSRRPAMGTFFEVFLAGDDEEHLEAVAAAVLDEVRRLERLLSRFDPASEIARINREAGRRPVRVDADLWDILCRCREYRRATGGFFDVTAASGRSAQGDALVLDDERRTVRFAGPARSSTWAASPRVTPSTAAGRSCGGSACHAACSTAGPVRSSPWAAIPTATRWPIDVRDPFGHEGRARRPAAARRPGLLLFGAFARRVRPSPT